MLTAFSQINASKLGRRELYQLKQGNKAISSYVNAWHSNLANIPADEQPNKHNKIYHFSEGLNEKLQALTSVDFGTHKPFSSVQSLITAAMHIDAFNGTASTSYPFGYSDQGNARSSQSGKKRDNESLALCLPKKANSSGSPDKKPGAHILRLSCEEQNLSQNVRHEAMWSHSRTCLPGCN